MFSNPGGTRRGLRSVALIMKELDFRLWGCRLPLFPIMREAEKASIELNIEGAEHVKVGPSTLTSWCSPLVAPSSPPSLCTRRNKPASHTYSSSSVETPMHNNIPQKKTMAAAIDRFQNSGGKKESR